MNWGYLLGTVLIAAAIALFEWPKLKQKKKEKAAFIVITSLGVVIAVLLLINPDMPGPTQWIDFVYKPLGKYLEK